MLARLSEAEHQLPQQPCQRDSKHQNPVGRASKTITTWPKQTAAETGLLQRTLVSPWMWQRKRMSQRSSRSSHVRTSSSHRVLSRIHPQALASRPDSHTLLSAQPPMEERLLKIKVVQTALVCSSQQSWELSILPMLQRWKLRRGQQDQSLQSGSDPVCTAFPSSPTPSSVSHSPFTGRDPTF